MEELETQPEGVSPEPETTAANEPLTEEPAAEPSPAEPESEPRPFSRFGEPGSGSVSEEATEPPSEGPSIPAEPVHMDELLIVEEPPAPVEDSQLRAVLEALVYVAEDPLTVAQMAQSLDQPPDRIREVLAQLIAEFDKPEHGLCIREVANGYKMATKPEHHDAVRTFVKSLKAPLKLSLPALETLAVIAYKQPVTTPEIMEIRGVQGGGVLKTLLDRKLITEAGRKNVIGKPILFKTTKEFLIQFGLKDLSELPSLKEFEEIRRMAIPDVEAPEPPADAQESLPLATAPPPAEPLAPETAAQTAAEAESEPRASASECLSPSEPESAADPATEPESEREQLGSGSSTEPAPESPAEPASEQTPEAQES